MRLWLAEPFGSWCPHCLPGEDLGAASWQEGTLTLQWGKQTGQLRAREGQVALGGTACHSDWEPLSLLACIFSQEEITAEEEGSVGSGEPVSGQLEPAGVN